MARASRVYVALIGDLVSSRELAGKTRERLQRELVTWLARWTEELEEELASPLILTAGDELQGLFRKPSALVAVVQDLTDRMLAYEGQPRVVFGAGRGVLTTGPIPAAPKRVESPALLDGPAFHNARAALEHVQELGGWVRFQGFGAPDGVWPDDVLDALFTLMGCLRERWTVNQARVSRLMRGWPGIAEPLQRDLAEHLGISNSVVSETLRAARPRELLDAEEAARVLLDACGT